MPGKSFSGELPPWTADELSAAEALRAHVEVLAGEIGIRNVRHPDRYDRAANYIEEQFASCGYEVTRQKFEVEGIACYNLEVEIEGSVRPDEILVVGAHYDTISSSPGANDNASGVAATIALACLLRESRPERTLRFVAFANEEAPWWGTTAMGSVQYAQRSRARDEKIIGMLSLETIGYFSDEPASQKYPFPFNLFYPSEGNFLAFITTPRARPFLAEVVGLFRKHAALPSEGAAIPERVRGVGWSDHWAFWQEGYRAIMITDTAPYRYPEYHTADDKPDRLDYHRMARAVKGLENVLEALAKAEE